jgi:hypothetical protein
MPVRIRKTFTLFPGVKVNLSKGGMSISVGKKGFTLNFSKHGVRQTTGLPGTGISHTSYLFKNDDEDDEKENKKRSMPLKAATTNPSDARAGPSRNERHHPGASSSLFSSHFSSFTLVQMPWGFSPRTCSQTFYRHWHIGQDKSGCNPSFPHQSLATRPILTYG